MGQGIEIYARDGSLLFDGANRLGRVVDMFQPNLGPGSKTYEIDANLLDFVYLQGDGKILTVWKEGRTIRWNLTDAYDARAVTGDRQLIVVTY